MHANHTMKLDEHSAVRIFEEFFRKDYTLQRDIYRGYMARRGVKSDEDMEDIIFDMLYILLKAMKGGKLGADANLKAYSQEIINIKTMEYFRKKGQAPKREYLDGNQLSSEVIRVLDDICYDAEMDLEQKKSSEKKMNALELAISQMDEPDKSYMMSYMKGMKPGAIAEKFDRKVGSVRTRISRAKTRLAHLFKNNKEIG